MDRISSLKLGRPPTLRAEDANVDLPLEVDDQYITNDCVTPRQPIGAPSFTSLFVTATKLVHIVYDMLEELYLSGPDSGLDRNSRQSLPRHYHHVLSSAVLLDSKLQLWWDTAPRHLTQEPIEGERSFSDFQCQRIVLRIR